MAQVTNIAACTTEGVNR